VGDGGDGSLRLEIPYPIIHADNGISCKRGGKGLCWRSSGAGDTGGQGAGRFTRDGRAHSYVPMGSTELLAPHDGNASMDIPQFSWKPVHGSTTNGPVVAYDLQVAFEDDFEIPVHWVTVENSTVNFTMLEKGVLHWRVTPLYSRPHRSPGIPSQPFVYDHLNAPPMVDEVPQANVTVKRPYTVDLGPYIHDIDDPVEDLTVTVHGDDVHWTAGFLVTLRYDAFEPPHDVTFEVHDGMDSTEGTIPVRVIENNHDPILLGWGPFDAPLNLSIPEGSVVSHKVRYFDADGDDVTIRLITPWAGVYLIENETVVIKADKGDAGRYEPVVIAEDGRGGRSQMTFFLKVGDVGEPPEAPEFLSPRYGARYDEGDNVLFSIAIRDPDLAFGGSVNLTVISNSSGVLFDGPVQGDVNFTRNDLKPGRNFVTAIVQDGEFEERSNITVVVVGEPEGADVWSPPEGLWLILGLLGTCLAGLSVSYYAGYRRRRARSARRAF
jgi:hypothetical protein